MDSKFDRAVNEILKQEGGYVNDKTDRGGETNFGISLRFLKLANLDLNDDGVIDGKDIRDMSREDSKVIYKVNWWDKYKYDLINDYEVATKIFSLAVNMGAHQAHKLAQIAVNRLREQPIKVDGILGAASIRAINTEEPHALLDEIKVCAAHFYINLIADNRQYEKYLLGWMRRAFD